MTYVYFHKPNDANGFLSQWYPCKITEGNIVFSSAEQYMMYHKAKLFGDLQSAMLIKQENNPAKIKVLGRNVKGFEEKIWNSKKEDIVLQGNLLKFKQNEKILEQFMKYGTNSIFIEASPYDSIWGIGFSAKDAPDKKKLWGQNLLGKILTKLRSEEFRQNKS